MLSVMKFSLRKTFIIFNILLLLFFSSYVAPRAHAFAFAPFLAPAAGTLTLAGMGPALLAVGVIAAGVYVGMHSDEIIKEIHVGWNNATSGVKKFWDSLDASTQAEFNTAAQSVAANSSSTQSVPFSEKMSNAVRTFYTQGNVGYSTKDSTAAVLSDHPMVATGTDYAVGATLTQSYIDTYAALTFTAGDGSKWAFVPMRAIYDIAAGSANIKYHWAMWTPSVPAWKMQGSTGFGFSTVFTQGISTGVGAGSQLGTYYNSAGELFSYKQTAYSVYNSVPALIAQYKWYMNLYYPGITIGTATWVPNLDDFKDKRIPGIGTLKVPAGSITQATGATTVGVTATSEMTTTLAESISTPATPPVSDPWTPTGSLDFRPLVVAGQLFTTKFPFSIPWDVKRQFNVFNVEPKAPVLKVDKQIPVFGTNIGLKFDIDFTIFDPLAKVTRWFLIIAFDIALILGIRKLLPE